MSTRPKCSFWKCDFDAAWAAPAVDAEATGSPECMCEYHFAEYSKFKTQRTPGLEPPPGASDFWQPSLIEMIRHASMEARRQEAINQAPTPAAFQPTALERELKWTPQQREQAMFLRRMLRA